MPPKTLADDHLAKPPRRKPGTRILYVPDGETVPFQDRANADVVIEGAQITKDRDGQADALLARLALVALLRDRRGPGE